MNIFQMFLNNALDTYSTSIAQELLPRQILLSHKYTTQPHALSLVATIDTFYLHFVEGLVSFLDLPQNLEKIVKLSSPITVTKQLLNSYSI